MTAFYLREIKTMGFSSELAIETHNAAMESDAEYAADYIRHCEEEMWARSDDESVYDSDWLLDHTGYQEFRCPLCYEFTPGETYHRDCRDEEQAWADAESLALAEDEAWRYLNEVW
jgi:hypothetical protein